MIDNNIRWEPKSDVHPVELERIAFALTDGIGGVSILKNGTFLFISNSDDDERNARKLSSEFKNLYNFEIIPVDVDGYLVKFHDAVAVFVGEDEFRRVEDEVNSRIDDLCFNGERIEMPVGVPEKYAIIGLYARGKLWRDASDFGFYKRL